MLVFAVIAAALLLAAAGGAWLARRRPPQAEAHEELAEVRHETPPLPGAASRKPSLPSLVDGHQMLTTSDGRASVHAWLLPQSESRLLGPTRTAGRPLVAPQSIAALTTAMPALHSALQAGKFVRVLGPPELVQGIRQGTLTMMQSEGNLGTVVGKSGKIVGQLRFGDIAKAPALVCPMAVFHLAAFAAVAVYLERISRQLDRIESGIAELHRIQKYRVKGMLDSVTTTTIELEKLLSNRSAHFDEAPHRRANDMARLDRAREHAIMAYAEARGPLEGLRRNVDKLIAPDGSVQRDAQPALASVLKQAMDSLPDVELLLQLMLSRVRLLRIRAWLDADANPSRIAIVQEQITDEFETLEADYRWIADVYQRLNVTDAQVRASKYFAPPLREIREYRAATKPLRKLLATPSERVLLPVAAPPTPYVLELHHAEDGRLEAHIESVVLSAAV